MAQPRRGRPPNPVDPEASHGARLGFEIRTQRIALDLTLGEFGALTGYTAQYVSEVERAKTTPAAPFIVACERALDAHGELEPLLPAVLQERERKRQERAAARRASLPCAATHNEAGDEDVDPTNRRGLLGAGAAAALSGGGAVSAASAREIDPGLVAHWTRLLSLLGRHNAMFGPHEALPTVLHELELIAGHRALASGDLRIELMRVEARWTGFAAWLSNDTGQLRDRDTLTSRVLGLAKESGYQDMVAFARMRQSQWAAQQLDAHRAIAFAEAALRIPRTSEQTRARCELRAAFGHALANDVAACERSLAAAEGSLEHGDDPSFVWPWVGRATIRSHVRPDEARCWLRMRPAKAIPLYENVLREWPRDQPAMGGLHQARLALACAAIGEHDRARAEGRKALAIARTTNSGRATRELKRLSAELRAA